jgi:hypothetical protein
MVAFVSACGGWKNSTSAPVLIRVQRFYGLMSGRNDPTKAVWLASVIDLKSGTFFNFRAPRARFAGRHSCEGHGMLRQWVNIMTNRCRLTAVILAEPGEVSCCKTQIEK